MNTYPYYVSAYVDGGILRKIFNNKKFSSYNKVVDATKYRYEALAKITKHNAFLTSQIAILEYTKEYEGRIITLFTEGNEVNILTPKK